MIFVISETSTDIYQEERLTRGWESHN